VKRFNRNRRDANEHELVTHARALGAQWLEEGPLDGWIYFRGVFTPTEIKTPECEGSSDEYTPAQLRFFRWCSEYRAKWFAWRTLDDVERDLGARRAA
jgi:hypothetical protein